MSPLPFWPSPGYLDFTEAEADKILASHDPLGVMATVDFGKLGTLMSVNGTRENGEEPRMNGNGRECRFL